MINILADIAKDQEIVNDLKNAVTDGTLLKQCPFEKRNLRSVRVENSCCTKVCHRIWPDLQCFCPCHKTDREAIVNAIIAISNLYEKLYRFGDVFSYNNRLFILLTVDGDHYTLLDVFTKSDYLYLWAEPMETEVKGVYVNEDEIKDLMCGCAFTYCGHISELTIKNGQLIK